MPSLLKVQKYLAVCLGWVLFAGGIGFLSQACPWDSDDTPAWCSAEYAALERAVDRRTALGNHIRGATGAERAELFAELRDARMEESDKDRLWQSCMLRELERLLGEDS